jgi:flagellar biosynthesis protein FlhF
MRIKRFEAPDTSTALALVKEEMGEDAVILATKVIKAARAGKPGKVEVVAAMDYDLDSLTKLSEGSKPADQEKENEKIEPVQPPRVNEGQRVEPKNNYRRPFPPKPVREEKKKKNSLFAPENIAVAENLQNKKTDNIELEAQQLRKRFANLLKEQQQKTPDPLPMAEAPKKKDRPERRTGVMPVTRKVFDTSAQTPVPELVSEPLNRPNPKDVAKWREKLIDKITISVPEASHEKKPRVIVLTGATGVGKTTSAANIAAWFSIHQRCRVAMATMDCFRIGATDQLRAYSRVMRLKCDVVLRQKDISRIIQKYQDQDIIILDTTGRSPYDSHHLEELKDWLQPKELFEFYLVLSATTKKEDLAQIIKAYAGFSVKGLVLTKLDETRAYAALCQIIVGAGLPISFLGTGQRVPEDFQVASEELMGKLFRNELFK